MPTASIAPFQRLHRSGSLKGLRPSTLRRWIAGAIALLAVCLWPAPAAAELGWKPERTWVFAVCLLEWQHANIWSPMPGAQANRRDVQLVKLFRDRGVPDDQLIYLSDRAATKRNIERSFKQLLQRAAKGDLLVFYFAGHGSRNRKNGKSYFANYDAGKNESSVWQVSSIFDSIEQHFPGDRALLMADCCFSGALYDEARRRRAKIGYACLTSAYSHNTSTGAWTFTDSLLKGLRGEPAVDLDADGSVELAELARFAELDMAFYEGQKSMFVATPGFEPEISLADALGPRSPQLGKRVEVLWEGTWYKAQVIDHKDALSKIHYAGYGDEDDEWVTADRIRPFKPRQFPAGAKVHVKWTQDGKWYPGVVRQAWQGLHLVHYDGYSNEWDEWVAAHLLRSRR